MTKLFFTGALACTIALGAVGSIEAGRRERRQVVVAGSDGFFWAEGNAGDVYNSPGKVEMIFCRANVFNNGVMLGTCFAMDEKGRSLSCFTDDERFVKHMLGVNGDSTILFEILDGECRKLAVTNGSLAAPKSHEPLVEALPFVDMTGQPDEVSQ